MRAVDASRMRMVGFLERLHAERDPRVPYLGALDHPRLRSERMAVEGCSKHDILISSREGDHR